MTLLRLPVLTLILTLAFCLQGCGTTGSPDPAGPKSAAGAEAASAQATGGAPTEPGETTRPPTADIGDEVIVTCTLGSLDAILNQGLAYVQPHLPGPFKQILQPEALKRQLFRVFDLPQLEQVLEADKPLALAIADPQTYRGRVGPLIVAFPVNDPDATADLLGQAAERHTRTAWDDHHYVTSQETIRVRFAQGYAFVAAHEKLINGAAGLLMPLIDGAKGASAQLRVNLEAVNALHGQQIERAVSKLRRKTTRRAERGDIGEAGLMQQIGRWIGYLKSTSDLRASLELSPSRIHLSGALEAKGPGAFGSYLAELSPGRPWGAKYVPAESGMFYLTRESPKVNLRNLDETLALFQNTLKEIVPAPVLQRLRDAVARSYQTFSGEGAAGIWVNADGAVGAGGAAKVTEMAAARAAWRTMARLLAAEVNRIFTTGLRPELKKQLEGFSIGIKLRENGLRMAGATGDLLEIAVVWPRPKSKEARKEIAALKKRVTNVIGSRLTVAVTFVDEAALVAAGKDHRRRMAAMIATAKGGAGSNVDQLVQGFVAGKRMVALVHLPVATLAEQVMRLADQLTTVPPETKQVVHSMLPGPGKTVPATFVVHVEGQRLLLDAEISPELVGMIAKAGVAAVSRLRGGGAAARP